MTNCNKAEHYFAPNAVICVCGSFDKWLRPTQKQAIIGALETVEQLMQQYVNTLAPMRRKQAEPSRKQLTAQQNYLLQRIPSSYQMNGYKERTEPAEVKQARKVLDRWNKEEKLRQCQAGKRSEALLRKAREAVYFDTPEKALAIIRQCEKMLKGCEG